MDVRRWFAAALIAGLSVTSWVTGAGPAAAQIGTVTEYGVPTPQSMPQGITGGPDGNVWFTEEGANRIGRITPGGVITEFPLPDGGGPVLIVAGPDGNLWFTRRNTPRIGRISPAGTVQEFTLTSPASQSWAITVGPDGNLWYTDVGISAIGKLTTSGTATAYPLPAELLPPFPSAIAAGSDGGLWFTEESGARVGRVSTDGAIERFPMPAGVSSPVSIAAGAGGNLWVAALSGHIVQVSTAGAMTAFALDPGSSPYGVTAGPDGNVWFTEQALGRVGRITAGGTITNYPVPTPRSGPTRITAGPDGNMWFSATTGNGLGRVALSASAPPPPPGGPGFSPNPDPFGGILPGFPPLLPAITVPTLPPAQSPVTSTTPVDPTPAGPTGGDGAAAGSGTAAPATESPARLTATGSGSRAGREVTLAGDGFAPNQTLTVFLGDQSQPLKTVTADSSGRYRVVVTLPGDVADGDHKLVVLGLGSDGTQHRSVAVVDIGADGGLGGSGTSRAPLIAVAAGLIVAAGAGASATAWRRARYLAS